VAGGGESLWQVNGSDIYYNNGNVGIGTSNPQGLLQIGEPIIVTVNTYLSGVEEDIGISDSIDPEYTPDAKLEISSGGTGRDLLMLSSYPSGDGDLFIVKNSGNVGIGATTPSSPLTIKTVAGPDIELISSGSNADIMTNAAFKVGTTTSQPFSIITNNLYQMTVDSTGNVGIGTTSPAAKLDVSGDISTTSVYKIDGNKVLSTPGSNTLVGIEAGANTTGTYNTFSGYQAGSSNTTGSLNTFSGRRAGYSNTEGQSNTFLGGSAGYSNTTGNYNTAVGYWAGRLNSTGSGNVFIGYSAGYSENGSNKLYIANSSTNPPLIYGDFNTGRVGIGTTSPDAKLVVAGQIKVTGGTPAVGKVLTSSDASGLATWETPASAGDNLGNHTATQNVKLNGYWLSGDGGSEGVYVTNTGNVGIGTPSPADKLDVTGHINSNESYKLNGYTVVDNNGWSNIFVGQYAGINTTGSYNSALGYQALYSNTTGHDNSAMGHNALYGNTTGYLNLAVGHNALRFNTTGYSNSAVGAQSLIQNTTGYENSAVGLNALFNNNDGNYNSALGVGALFNNTTGSSNSALGVSAGYNNSTGSGNVFLGFQAGYNETGSNKLYIANSEANTLIYGDFSAGNVGIGTTYPAQKLHVAGNATIEGNVGIGTTTPARKLHVTDVMRLQPRSSAPSSPSEGDMYMDSSDHKLKVYDGGTWRACW
jgi:hypothetical protein